MRRYVGRNCSGRDRTAIQVEPKAKEIKWIDFKSNRKEKTIIIKKNRTDTDKS